ncbi:MAG: prepilin-type N-terminal cleavage/methylation domain-containing protein [Aestuariibacter sp.]|nr:prepilin-type N-terminal cleavage/methylation domain-containing protein [Aestuariibacter sp.]
MKRANNLGFTLVELMITLAIAGITLTLAVPALRETIIKNRVAAEVNSLVATLNKGRSEAVKRGNSVSFCTSSNGTSCGGNWEQGWLMFDDTDGDGAFDAGETLITVAQGFASSDTLSYTATNTFVRFKSGGFAQEAGVFKLCDSSNTAKYARSLYISSTGRVRLSSDTDGTGIHDDGLATSTELSCP